MSSNQIPGVPEGWELVHAMRRATKGEWYIDNDGTPHLQHMSKSVFPHPIIRKIERPAAYRPFKDAEEFKPHRDRWLTRIDENGQQIDGEFQLDGFDDTGIWLGANPLSYKDALDRGHTFDDGTPFGVRIDE
jgi:hypothetical protein